MKLSCFSSSSSSGSDSASQSDKKSVSGSKREEIGSGSKKESSSIPESELQQAVEIHPNIEDRMYYVWEGGGKEGQRERPGEREEREWVRVRVREREKERERRGLWRSTLPDLTEDKLFSFCLSVASLDWSGYSLFSCYGRLLFAQCRLLQSFVQYYAIPCLTVSQNRFAIHSVPILEGVVVFWVLKHYLARFLSILNNFNWTV